MDGTPHTYTIYALAYAKLARAGCWLFERFHLLSAIWWAVRPNKPPRSLLCGVPISAKDQAGISCVLHDSESRYSYREVVRDRESSFWKDDFDGGSVTCNEKWLGTLSTRFGSWFKDESTAVSFLKMPRRNTSNLEGTLVLIFENNRSLTIRVEWRL